MHLLHPIVYKVYQLWRDLQSFLCLWSGILIRPIIVLNLDSNPPSLYGLVNKHETPFYLHSTGVLRCPILIIRTNDFTPSSAYKKQDKETEFLQKTAIQSPDFPEQQPHSSVSCNACGMETTFVRNLTNLHRPFALTMTKLNTCLCICLPDEYLFMWSYKLAASHPNTIRISCHCCSFAFYASQCYYLPLQAQKLCM